MRLEPIQEPLLLSIAVFCGIPLSGQGEERLLFLLPPLSEPLPLLPKFLP